MGLVKTGEALNALAAPRPRVVPASTTPIVPLARSRLPMIGSVQARGVARQTVRRARRLPPFNLVGPILPEWAMCAAKFA